MSQLSYLNRKVSIFFFIFIVVLLPNSRYYQILCDRDIIRLCKNSTGEAHIQTISTVYACRALSHRKQHIIDETIVALHASRRDGHSPETSLHAPRCKGAVKLLTIIKICDVACKT